MSELVVKDPDTRMLHVLPQEEPPVAECGKTVQFWIRVQDPEREEERGWCALCRLSRSGREVNLRAEGRTE